LHLIRVGERIGSNSIHRYPGALLDVLKKARRVTPAGLSHVRRLTAKPDGLPR
jgi:hypothetical protein